MGNPQRKKIGDGSTDWKATILGRVDEANANLRDALTYAGSPQDFHDLIEEKMSCASNAYTQARSFAEGKLGDRGLSRSIQESGQRTFGRLAKALVHSDPDGDLTRKAKLYAEGKPPEFYSEHSPHIKGPFPRAVPAVLSIIGFGGAIASFLYNQSSNMTAAAVGVSGSSSPMQFFGLVFFLIGCFGIFLWRKK